MTVLDVSLGKPAEGVQVVLQCYRESGDFGVFDPISQQLVLFSFSRSTVDPSAVSATDTDGRCMALLPPRDCEGARQASQFQITAGIYKIIFRPQEYFERTGRKCFYPWIEVTNPPHVSSLLTDHHTDPLSHRKSRRTLPHSTSNQPVFVQHL